jgi:hypothetical protein
MTRLLLGALAAALSTTPAVPTPATMGPPWISIEYPVNPYDSSTKDAFLVVHAFHHGDPTNFPVSGSAEGIVSGQRRTVPLEFTRTSRTGVFALRKQWASEGAWTLVVGVVQGPGDRVSAIVELDRAGQVARVTVPTRRRDGHTIPAPVVMRDVESALRARAS